MSSSFFPLPLHLSLSLSPSLSSSSSPHLHRRFPPAISSTKPWTAFLVLSLSPPTIPMVVSVGPTVATLSDSCDARRCLSAANAAAKFIPEPDETGLTQSGSGLWPGGAWPRPTSITTTSSSSSSSSPSTTMLLSLTLVPPKTQVVPQQPIPFNPSRSFRLLRLLLAPSTPSICSLRKHRIVLVSLSLTTDSCNITPSWLIFTQTQKPKKKTNTNTLQYINKARVKRLFCEVLY